MRLKPHLIAAALIGSAILLMGDSNVGGFTQEVCVVSGSTNWAALTTGSAYGAGNEVGGLITLPAFYRTSRSGVAPQSVRLTFGDVQTAAFKAYQFSSKPTASTWSDKAAPAIASGDVNKVRPPITLSNNDSGLGTHTVYGADSIARAVVSGSTDSNDSDYWIIVTSGTPTFTTQAQFCASVLQD